MNEVRTSAKTSTSVSRSLPSYFRTGPLWATPISLQEILAVLRWPSSCPKVSLYGQEGCLACGTCRACRLIEEDEFSDVTVVRPVNQIIKTDRIRDLIQHFSQSGYEGSKQVFIICDADRMHVNAGQFPPQGDWRTSEWSSYFSADSRWATGSPDHKKSGAAGPFSKNQDFLKEYLLQEGLLLQQADLLANFSQGFQEAQILAQNTSFFDLARECERFVAALSKSRSAYLLTGLSLGSRDGW